MSNGQGCFKRAFPWGKGVVVLWIGGLTAWSGGCRAKLDSIQVVLERHEKAVAKLPDGPKAWLECGEVTPWG